MGFQIFNFRLDIGDARPVRRLRVSILPRRESHHPRGAGRALFRPLNGSHERDRATPSGIQALAARCTLRG
jgi:hypothetical protein